MNPDIYTYIYSIGAHDLVYSTRIQLKQIGPQLVGRGVFLLESLHPQWMSLHRQRKRQGSWNLIRLLVLDAHLSLNDRWLIFLSVGQIGANFRSGIKQNIVVKRDWTTCSNIVSLCCFPTAYS